MLDPLSTVPKSYCKRRRDDLSLSWFSTPTPKPKKAFLARADDPEAEQSVLMHTVFALSETRNASSKRALVMYRMNYKQRSS